MSKSILFLVSFILLVGCSPSQKDLDKSVERYFNKEENERAKIVAIVRDELRREGLIRDEVRTARVGGAPTFKNDQLPSDLAIIKRDGSPLLGSINAPVEIILYSEFQCPYCKQAKETLDKLIKIYPSKVKIYFKHRPLSFHSRAKEAAQFSMVAAKEGKFWAAHDLLFQKQNELKDIKFASLAASLGLKNGSWEKSMQDSAIIRLIERDEKEADALGISGTPTFFINGEKIVGSKPFEELKTIVEQKLK